MGNPYFEVSIRNQSLGTAFYPVQMAVRDAAEQGEPGSVFCQIQLKKDDSGGAVFLIKGAFYTAEKTKKIFAALTDANKVFIK